MLTARDSARAPASRRLRRSQRARRARSLSGRRYKDRYRRTKLKSYRADASNSSGPSRGIRRLSQRRLRTQKPYHASAGNLTPNPSEEPSPQARTPFPLPQAGEGNSVLKRHRGGTIDCEVREQSRIERCTEWLLIKVLTGAQRRILSLCGQTGSPKPAGGSVSYSEFFCWLSTPPARRRWARARGRRSARVDSTGWRARRSVRVVLRHL